MSDDVQIATLICGCITSIGTAAIGALVVYLQLRLRQLDVKVDQVKQATDGMHDTAIKATAAASFLAGEKSGIQQAAQSPGPSLLDPSRPAAERPSP